MAQVIQFAGGQEWTHVDQVKAVSWCSRTVNSLARLLANPAAYYFVGQREDGKLTLKKPGGSVDENIRSAHGLQTTINLLNREDCFLELQNSARRVERTDLSVRPDDPRKCTESLIYNNTVTILGRFFASTLVNCFTFNWVSNFTENLAVSTFDNASVASSTCWSPCCCSRSSWIWRLRQSTTQRLETI